MKEEVIILNILHIKKKKHNPVYQWAKNLNRHLKEDIPMVHKHEMVLNLISN